MIIFVTPFVRFKAAIGRVRPVVGLWRFDYSERLRRWPWQRRRFARNGLRVFLQRLLVLIRKASPLVGAALFEAFLDEGRQVIAKAHDLWPVVVLTPTAAI